MPVTTPSTNRTSSGWMPSLPPATIASRSRIWSQAFLTAPPLRSAPELAAVAEVLGTLSVRVGASRTELSGTPERGRGDLDHLGVQALAHLGAAVVDQHRAVLVDVHQRAGLVERGQVERDAELHRRHRQPALGVRVRRVERGDLGLAPAAKSLRSSQDRPDVRQPLGVPDRLPVRRGLARLVEVAPAQLLRARRPAAARSGRGCPRSRSCPAARRTRGTRCWTPCWSWRSGRAPRCWGSSRRCRCGRARGRAPARTGRGSSRRCWSAWRAARRSGCPRRSPPPRWRGTGAACRSW